MSLRNTLICAALFVLCGTRLSASTQYHVPTQFATVQEAINLASDGDTVIIHPGTYKGAGNTNLDFLGKAITVRSLKYDYGTVVINCEGNRGVTFHNGEGPGSILWGITIMDAYDPAGGNAILIDGASPIIRDCCIDANRAWMWNTTVLVKSGSPIFENCDFDSNYDTIWLQPAAQATVRQCIFTANWIPINVEAGGSVVVEDSKFDGSYFAVICNSAQASIARSTFTNIWGVAVNLSGGAAATVDACHFIGNLTGVSVVGTSVATVSGCEFDNNTGDGVFVSNTASVNVLNSKFTRNKVGLGMEGTPTVAETNGLFVANQTGVLVNGGVFEGSYSTMTANTSYGINKTLGSATAHIVNSIAWGNGIFDVSGTVKGNGCDVGTKTYPAGLIGAAGNVKLDPLFVRPASPGPDTVWGTADDDFGDLTLQINSPCVNRGVPYPLGPPTDLAGNPRVVGTIPDMGAYELGFAITVLKPAFAVWGGPTFDMMVNGSAFARGSVVTFGGTPLATTFVSNKSLRATVPASLLLTVGMFDVKVELAGEETAPASFTVGNPVPVINGIMPTKVWHGSPDFTLEVMGKGFDDNSVILWNGAPRSTSFNATTGKLSAWISAADIAAVGTATVQVSNPAPGGGLSKIKNLPIR